MDSSLFSISKIFTERLLRIPDYQRGYAWTEKQLKDFWNDLNQLESEHNHYFGVLTLEEVPEENLSNWSNDQWIVTAKSYTPYFIVDGQQRLTTTIILIQSITEVVDENTKLNYTSLTEIRKKFIFDSKDDGISRSYIFGYEKDNPSYEFLIKRIFLEDSENDYRIQETIYTHNLERAKSFFMKQLKELTLEEIEVLYKKITQNFRFNVYTISEDIDVYVAFETMNNRGKPLSHLELLKNRLIYLSTKFDTEIYERKRLRHAINESWKSVYHYLGKNKNNPLDDDLFLHTHFVLYFGDTIEDDYRHLTRMRRYGLLPRNVPYKDYLLEEKFTPRNIKREDNPDGLHVQDIHQYVKSLKTSVEVWYQLLNPEDSEFNDEVKYWLDKLNRLPIIEIAPLIMVFFQQVNDNDLRVKILQIVERFLFIQVFMVHRHYFEMDTSIVWTLATKMRANEITPDKVLKELRDLTDEMFKNPEIFKQITMDFQKRGFYQWHGIHYFLYEYELHLQSKSKSFRNKIDWIEFINRRYRMEDDRDHHTIEHIYPQRPRKKCWLDTYSKYNSKQKAALRNSLGNLVPLSKPKNSSFGNKCFDDKKGSAENPIGFKYGSLSENQIATYQQWTAVEIAYRGMILLGFMEERWNLNFGDELSKLKLLNVDFVLPIEQLDLANMNRQAKHTRSGKTTKTKTAA